jgi:two-component system, OmpR family, sensor histidine kinase KdpD
MGGRIHAESPAVKKKGTRIVMRFATNTGATLPAGASAQAGRPA